MNLNETKNHMVSYEQTGQLQLQNDESSSSDEEEENSFVLSSTKSVDSDEELEVFGSLRPIVKTTRKESTLVVPQNVLVESQKSHPSSLKEPVEETDIAITLPSEYHGSENVVIGSNTKDDEFDWDDNNIDEMSNTLKHSTSGVCTSISDILEKEKRKVNNEVIDFSEDIRQFNIAATQNMSPETDIEIHIEMPQEGSIILNLHTEAKLALKDVVGVYGEGLGDQSVLVEYGDSSVNVDNGNQQNDKELSRPTGVLDAIAEEDGEESEDDNDLINHENIPVVKSDVISVIKPVVGDNLFTDIDRFGEDFDVEKMAVTTDNKPSIFYQISYSHLLDFFRGLNLSSFNSKIHVENDSKSWLNGFLSVKLNYDGNQDDLKLPFLIAEVDYNPYESFHLNMLRSLYYFFLPDLFSESALLQAIDKRWELVGFQGSDPRTDLNRSMKCLSLLQISRFVEKEPKLAKALFIMSKCSSSSLQTRKEIESSWPFLCVGIMFTKEALSALRSGSLYTLCNKYKSSLEAIHLFYEACFIEFGKLLLKYPALHHAVHLSTIRRRCENDISKIMKHIFDRKAAKYIVDNELNLQTSVVDNLHFSNLDNDNILNTEFSSGTESTFGSRAKHFIANDEDN